jgi:serine/threonine protein kinase
LNEISRKHIFNEAQIKIIMEQALLALDFIHKKGIVHRDIKLENILINNKSEGEYDVKIADFGMATFC